MITIGLVGMLKGKMKECKGINGGRRRTENNRTERVKLSLEGRIERRVWGKITSTKDL